MDLCHPQSQFYHLTDLDKQGHFSELCFISFQDNNNKLTSQSCNGDKMTLCLWQHLGLGLWGDWHHGGTEGLEHIILVLAHEGAASGWVCNEDVGFCPN